MHVVVGLGNPGKKYEGTRHNVGFMVVDLLSQSPGADRPREKFQAEIVELRDGDAKILLVKPLTFMNLSGRSVRQALDFYQVEPAGLLVIADDINLPPGKLRFRARGTHGGHNGLRDIQSHLGTTDYSRLRIGVGDADEDLVDHVLGKFRPSERPVIEEALQKAVQGTALWWREGIEKCMNEYNA